MGSEKNGKINTTLIMLVEWLYNPENNLQV